ncbi:MAG: OB-fold nucleic acid binding domain-containing protein, partial [Candidatus Binataceae bacterium]
PLGFYHPSTLVKDAARHGVEVRPISVAHSDWKCTLEEIDSADSSPISLRQTSDTHVFGRNALRLGLRYVNGLREETGIRIEHERRRRPFKSLADFAARVAPDKREIESLAWAGTFACFGHSRREALWQAAAVERDPSSLLAGAEPADHCIEINGTVDDQVRENRGHANSIGLPAIMPLEDTMADYAATGVTVGPHLMAHLRARLKASGIASAADLAQIDKGKWVKVAGVVIVRQRPGTAKGFLFITMEDETGIANVIVTPDLFHENRALLHHASMLLVEGPLQKQEGIIHVKGRRFHELKLGGAIPPSHDFR